MQVRSLHQHRQQYKSICSRERVHEIRMRIDFSRMSGTQKAKANHNNWQIRIFMPSLPSVFRTKNLIVIQFVHLQMNEFTFSHDTWALIEFFFSFLLLQFVIALPSLPSLLSRSTHATEEKVLNFIESHFCIFTHERIHQRHACVSVQWIYPLALIYWHRERRTRREKRNEQSRS